MLRNNLPHREGLGGKTQLQGTPVPCSNPRAPRPRSCRDMYSAELHHVWLQHSKCVTAIAATSSGAWGPAACTGHFSTINGAGPGICQRKVHTKCWTLKVMHQPAAHFAAIVSCRLPQSALPGWNWHRLLAETILAVTRLALRGRWQSFNTCSHFIEPSGHLSLPCREGR